MKTHIEDCFAQSDGSIRYLIEDAAGRAVTVDQTGSTFAGFVRLPWAADADADHLLRSAIRTARDADDAMPEEVVYE